MYFAFGGHIASSALQAVRQHCGAARSAANARSKVHLNMREAAGS